VTIINELIPKIPSFFWPFSTRGRKREFLQFVSLVAGLILGPGHMLRADEAKGGSTAFDSLFVLRDDDTGLSGRPLRAAPDGTGGLWIAGEGELVRWTQAGLSTRLTAAATAWMADGRVTQVVPQGRAVWFATPAGVGRLGQGAPAWFGVAAGLPDARVLALSVDPAGSLLAGTWRGLARFDHDRFLADGPSYPVSALGASGVHAQAGGSAACAAGGGVLPGPRFVTSFLPKGEGLLAGGDGLWLCTDSRWRPLTGDSLRVHALADVDGETWIGAARGLLRLSSDGRLMSLPPLSTPVTALRVAGGGVIAGTWGQGLWRCGPDGCDRLAGVAADALVASLAADESRLWVSTTAALYRCEETCSPIVHDELDAALPLGAVAVDDDGGAWVGSPRGGGILRITAEGAVTRWAPDRHLPDAAVHDLLQYDGLLWLATDSGLTRFADEQFVPRDGGSAVRAILAGDSLWVGSDTGLRQGSRQIDLPPGASIRALAAADDRLWAGGPEGLFEVAPDGTVVAHTDALPSPSVRDLSVDVDGVLWVATSGGLARFDGAWRSLGAAEGLPSPVLWAVHADSRGGVWVGTLGGGAARYDGTTFHRLTGEHGLPSHVVRQIFEDDSGSLWLLTDRGLAALSVERLPDLRPSSSSWKGVAAGALLLLVALAFLMRRRRGTLAAVAAGLLATSPGGADEGLVPDPTLLHRPASGWIDLRYDWPAAAGDTAYVVLEASADGGRTWDLPVVSVVGDVGRRAAAPGRIAWQAALDLPGALVDSCTVRLRWSTTPPIPAGRDMIRVAAGSFEMGSDGGDRHERPPHRVTLSAFEIDRFETTNRAFQWFVQSTGWQTLAEREGESIIYRDGGYHTRVGAAWMRPEGHGSDLRGRLDHPVVQVSWDDADAYCRWAGKRLPSEAQWERAARGTDGRTYPWGEAPAHGAIPRANAGAESCCRESAHDGYLTTAPVGSFPGGLSPVGAHDMSGNAWEWTQDGFLPSFYSEERTIDPVAPDAEERVLRGGSWISFPHMLRTTYRGHHTPETRHNYSGFRCARVSASREGSSGVDQRDSP
jgi:sulfatase modifying factor 1